MSGDECQTLGRRTFDWQHVGKFAAAGDAEPDVRQAAKLWCKNTAAVLGQYTTPRQLPDLSWVTTARCFQCVQCHADRGKTMKNIQIFRLAG